VSATWPWLALVGLGAFHGLNPAMGWLFAVARGLQSRSRGVVLRSMMPIAAGHAVSVAAVVAATAVLRAFIDFTTLQIGAAVGLIAFGLYRLFARHRGRVGMQVGGRQLLLWSCLMATAHGAGLMLIPVLLRMPSAAPYHGEHAHAAGIASLVVSMGSSTGTALTVIGIHTLAMLATAGMVAIVVYEWVGLAFLRRGWVNFDLLWVLALIGAGTVLLIAI